MTDLSDIRSLVNAPVVYGSEDMSHLWRLYAERSTSPDDVRADYLEGAMRQLARPMAQAEWSHMAQYGHFTRYPATAHAWWLRHYLHTARARQHLARDALFDFIQRLLNRGRTHAVRDWKLHFGTFEDSSGLEVLKARRHFRKNGRRYGPCKYLYVSDNTWGKKYPIELTRSWPRRPILPNVIPIIRPDPFEAFCADNALIERVLEVFYYAFCPECGVDEGLDF